MSNPSRESFLRRLRRNRLTPHQVTTLRTIDSARRRRARSNLSDASAADIRALDTSQRRRARLEMPASSSNEVRATDANNRAEARIALLAPAFANFKIFCGRHEEPVEDRVSFYIGSMNVICIHCGARKFAKEAGSICCNSGKVKLDFFPEPPPYIQSLWSDSDYTSRLFQKNCRIVNNAICLSSLLVKEKRFPGFTPCVTFEGKVYNLIGPLQSADANPKYSQIYVHDEFLENSIRFNNLLIPNSMSQQDANILKDVVLAIQNILHEINPYVHDFKHIMEINDADILPGKLMLSANARPSGGHRRRYNDFHFNEVSLLMDSLPHDLIIHKRDGGLHTISSLNPHGMPLHFTLLFPHGTKGWGPSRVSYSPFVSNRKVTPREFFAFYLHLRENTPSFLLRAKRLLQEWICTAWAIAEEQKLNFIQHNQKSLRADSYKNIRHQVNASQHDHFLQSDSAAPKIGQKILPSSFVGSPRYYNRQFQDAMAICRKYHKPDLFITLTCNPKWPEILAELKEGETAMDRPDLVARVFKQYRDCLINDLHKKKFFGKVKGILDVIEFQKRGLPHCHILLIVSKRARINLNEHPDAFISAELPPEASPAASRTRQRRIQQLEDLILTHMVHGKCGLQNPTAPCMENGVCSKHYPKPYSSRTNLSNQCNPVYRRRSPSDGGRSVVRNGRTITNADVVPHCPRLLLKYNCHINVEICTSARAAKYLYKYVTKGPDRAMIHTSIDSNGQGRDEVKEYADLRSFGSVEAAWRLYRFPIAHHYPPVMALRVHLNEEQQVMFEEHNINQAFNRNRETELTAFFTFNRSQLSSGVSKQDLPSYVEMPEKHRFIASRKEWIPRSYNKTESTIGRINSVHPLAGDVFYLRMLLNDDHCKGATSFEDLLTVQGTICSSYKEACNRLGYLKSDNEWRIVLHDAQFTSLCPNIRKLFTVLLIFCEVSNPRELFEDFWLEWVDDFSHNNHHELTELQLKTLLLLDLDRRLQTFDKSLHDFDLPEPSIADIASVQHIMSTEPAIIREELNFDVPNLIAHVESHQNLLTPEQRQFYDATLAAVRQHSQILAFLNARGGCGKTFLLNLIIDRVRSLDNNGCVALAMATTGIAATLLHGGRTFHSRMRAPLDTNETSMLSITAQSALSRLIKMAKLLIIDEATMLDRFLLEALDRSLRDILAIPDLPFGGKSVILAGDFRQCLPVSKGANRAGIVERTIKKSDLWQLFLHFTLNTNLRVNASASARLRDFDKWTLKIGDGKVSKVNIPRHHLFRICQDNPENEEMLAFLLTVFPWASIPNSTSQDLHGKCILAPTNREVSLLNQIAIERLPGNAISLYSSDSLERTDDSYRFNIEYLNTLVPDGFPPHKLLLKPGMPVTLIRNLNPAEGLCNGTRLVFEEAINTFLLKCRNPVDNGITFLPRIDFIPKRGDYSFDWRRRQFPIKPGFASTINKSQGQTFDKIGVWLNSNVFTHGQLYVAVSRVRSPDDLHIAVPTSSTRGSTLNVVYPEVLL